MADALDELLASLGMGEGGAVSSPVAQSSVQGVDLGELLAPVTGTRSSSPGVKAIDAMWAADSAPRREQPQVAALLKPSGTVGDQAARVNANSSNTGVKAVLDAKGQLSLSNVDETGMQYPKANGGQGPGTGAISPNTPLSVGSLLSKLKSASDVDTARGIGASLREASALEQVKFETQAQQFAGQKIGLPRLVAELAAAEAADRADPKYVPGMGDSPITAKIRTDVDQARNFADGEAKRYLAQNPQYAVLKASLATADSEIARITKLADRKAAIEDNALLRADITRQAKEDQLTDEARGLDGPTRQRLLMLSPDLAQVDPAKLDADMVRTIKARGKDKAWMQALQAPEEALPALALVGNQHAVDLVVAKEEANTGNSPEITLARIENLRKSTLDGKFMKKAFEEQFASEGLQGKALKTKVDDSIAAFNAKGLTAEGKQQNQAVRMQMALELAKKSATTNFANNAGSWRINDPEFQQALTQAKQVTGKSDMKSVMVAYMGNATGPELVSKSQKFADLMTAEAQKQEKSIFGIPDYRALRSQVFQHQANGGIRNWLESVGRWMVENTPEASVNAVAGGPEGSATGLPKADGTAGGINIPDPMYNPDGSIRPNYSPNS